MIVLDVETTGTEPSLHSILSIGALDLAEPTNQFYDECRMWEGAKIEGEALAINGFTKEEAQDASKKSEAELVKAFIAWATDKPQNWVFAAQNVSFDYEFIRAAAKRAHLDFPFAKRTLDIHSLAWLHMKERGVPLPAGKHSVISSSFILRYCGLPEEPSPHNALTGALWHAEVVSRMAYNKKLLPDFDSYEIPWTHS